MMKSKIYIERYLKKFPEVMWDRFARDEVGLTVYGWIERKEDGYKDFMILNFVNDEYGPDLLYDFFVTSSAKYTKEFAERLGLEHSDCERVEDVFKIENCIKLKIK